VAAVDLFHEFSAGRERDARDKTLGRTRESILIALFHSRSFSRRVSRASLVIQTFGALALADDHSAGSFKEIREQGERVEREKSRDKESNERVTNRELRSLSPLGRSERYSALNPNSFLNHDRAKHFGNPNVIDTRSE